MGIFYTKLSNPEKWPDEVPNGKYRNTKVMRANPLGTMNVFTKRHGNLSSGCVDISVQTLRADADVH